MNIAVLYLAFIPDLTLAASTASVIGFFVPSPNSNATLPFCSPVKEQLRCWSWTGASVNTDEVIHNLDCRQTYTNIKEPQMKHPRPWDGILTT